MNLKRLTGLAALLLASCSPDLSYLSNSRNNNTTVPRDGGVADSRTVYDTGSRFQSDKTKFKDAYVDIPSVKDFGNDIQQTLSDGQTDSFPTEDSSISVYRRDASIADAEQRPDLHSQDAAADAHPVNKINDAFSLDGYVINDALPSDGSVPDVAAALPDARTDALFTFPDATSGCSGEQPLNSQQQGVCSGSYRTCVAGIWEDDYSGIGNYEVVETRCDNLDNDCDTLTDEGLLFTLYRDNDNDGYGYLGGSLDSCDRVALGYVPNSDDCNDDNGLIYPGQSELCDDLDNNCDEEIDELFLVGNTCYDEIGECRREGIYECAVSGLENRCTAVAGEPEAELCDELDQDCDGDSYNGYAIGESCTVGTGECIREGRNRCSVDLLSVECNTTPSIPTNEDCDGLDNDCNYLIDDNLIPPRRDCTNGVGECQSSGLEYATCLGTEGWSSTYSGCDAVPFSPVAELCNALDDDCDSLTDEDLTPPNQRCIAGTGECQSSGLEYATCLGTEGWSSTYSGCDAVPTEPTIEICDRLDNDCNSFIDDITGSEVLDNFNRPDQDDLGINALGNDWVNYGTADDWDIESEAAVTSWTGGTGSNPLVSSEIRYRSAFDILLMFRLSEVRRGEGDGAFIYGVNCTPGSLDGLVARIAQNDQSTHGLYRSGVRIAGADMRLNPLNDYLMRLTFDGAELGLKLWREGTVEPADYLASVVTTNVPSTQSFTTITGNIEFARDQIIIVDYLINEGDCGN